MIKVEKPWGYELILTPEWFPFTVKFAFSKANSCWSLQYHEIKREVIFLVCGKATFKKEDKFGNLLEKKMSLLRPYFVDRMKKHRFCAKTNCYTLELSTPEKGKTIRIEDNYGRENETENERKRAREKLKERYQK